MSSKREPAQREQVAQRRAELVDGRLAHRGEAPVLDELGPRRRSRGGSGCSRRRRPAAWRAGRLDSPRRARRRSTPYRPRTRAPPSRPRCGSRASTTSGSTCSRSPPSSSSGCASAARPCPAVRFSDGEKVLGSREILRALEHRAPDPPLLPADGRERRGVEEAERWGDEVLQPIGRRLAWAAMLRSPGSMMGYAEQADLPIPDALLRLGAPLTARASARVNGASDPAVRADLINLDFHLDRADAWIAQGRHRRLRDDERRRPADRLRGAAPAHHRGPAAADRGPAVRPRGAAALPGVPGPGPRRHAAARMAGRAGAGGGLSLDPG